MLFLIPSWLAWPCASAVEAWEGWRAAGGRSDHHSVMLAPDSAIATLETPAAPHGQVRCNLAPQPGIWGSKRPSLPAFHIYKQLSPPSTVGLHTCCPLSREG